MLFRPFRVIYTVKELDSHAKHGQSFKNNLEVWLSISVAKIFLPGSYKFRKVFFNHGSCWRKRRWDTIYGNFSRKNAPVHASTRARARPSTRFIQRDSLGKNVSKEVCFWLWGKDNLVQLPKRTQRYVNSGRSLFFFGAAMDFHKCVCWRTFYKQGPVWRWICTSFDTERWSNPSYKRSRSWFRTADGKWNGIKCLCFVLDRSKWSSLFSSALFSSARSALAPPPGARLFSERIVKLYLSFINMIKLKTFWRYEGCSTTL